MTTVAGSVCAPHLLEIIELPYVGFEYVDDRVPGVEQHPVAMRHAFDSRRPETRLATPARHSVGDSADVNIRTSGSDDHQVGDGGSARQVDRNDVFGLGILENPDHGPGEAPVGRRCLGFERRRAAARRAESGLRGLMR